MNDDVKSGQEVLHIARKHSDLRTGFHLNRPTVRPRCYVPVGNLMRKQALSDKTWNRMVKLGLVDAKSAKEKRTDEAVDVRDREQREGRAGLNSWEITD